MIVRITLILSGYSLEVYSLDVFSYPNLFEYYQVFFAKWSMLNQKEKNDIIFKKAK